MKTAVTTMMGVRPVMEQTQTMIRSLLVGSNSELWVRLYDCMFVSTENDGGDSSDSSEESESTDDSESTGKIKLLGINLDTVNCVVIACFYREIW